jgi:hypothetical protein
MTTVEALQEILNPAGRQNDRGTDFLEIIPQIECSDGFTMSVQTGRTHYCKPRDNYGPWHSAEVGYPSARVEEFMPYIDGKDSDPTDTVYGYVPMDVIAAVIDQHGGFTS